MLRRLTLVALGAAAACSSSYGDVAPSGDAGTGDAGSTEAASPAGRLTDAGEDAAAIRSCFPEKGRPVASARRLFTPPSVGFAYPFGIATSPSAVFWLEHVATTDDDARGDAYNGVSSTVRIRRVEKSGERSSEVLVDASAVAARAVALAVDGESLYWTAPTAESQQGIYRVATDCTSPCTPKLFATIAGARVRQMMTARPGLVVLVTDNGAVFTFDGKAPGPIARGTVGGPFVALASTSTTLYVGRWGDGAVWSAAVEGTSAIGRGPNLPLEDAAADQGPTMLATNCESVFVLRGGAAGYAVWRTGLDNGVASSLFTVARADYFTMAVDGTNLYLGAANAGGLTAVELATGERSILTTKSVWNMAVDGDGVYWGDHDSDSIPGVAGSIWMLPKD